MTVPVGGTDLVVLGLTLLVVRDVGRLDEEVFVEEVVVLRTRPGVVFDVEVDEVVFLEDELLDDEEVVLCLLPNDTAAKNDRISNIDKRESNIVEIQMRALFQ